MNWIYLKNQLPEKTITLPGEKEPPLILLYHTVHGVGFGYVYVLDCEGMIEELEEDFKDCYICSFAFISPHLNEDYFLETYGENRHGFNGEDIFAQSPHDPILGTVTHWMPLPEPPVVGGND